MGAMGTGHMNMSMGECSSMSMSGFDMTGKDQCFVFLFSSWKMDTDAKLWVGAVATFSIAILCELTRAIPAAYESRRGTSVHLDMALSGLYGLQMAGAYVLMLLVMTMEVKFFVAVISGLSVGNFAIIRHRARKKRRKAALSSLYQAVNGSDAKDDAGKTESATPSSPLIGVGNSPCCST